MRQMEYQNGRMKESSDAGSKLRDSQAGKTAIKQFSNSVSRQELPVVFSPLYQISNMLLG